MAAPICELRVRSNARHLQQLFTGFAALARRGLIDLRQTLLPPPAADPHAPAHVRDARVRAHLEVILGGEVRIYYDTHDSWEIDAAALATAHVYFKRSFSAARLQGLAQGDKVRPLGMFYAVHPSWVDRFAAARVLAFERGPKVLIERLLRTMDTRNRLIFAPRMDALEALPDFEAPPAALFMANAWDPASYPDLPADKLAEIEALNETRAQCIRLLRRELRSDFYGGFGDSDFVRRRYGDCIVDDPRMTRQRHYLAHLQRYSIGIATEGIHGSTGGKLAEYVCCAKAVVAQTPQYEVPGAFAAGRHYLAFDTPQECVEQTVRLFADRPLRHALMLANARYYQSHLRPDVLVLNTLLAALCPSTGSRRTEAQDSTVGKGTWMCPAAAGGAASSESRAFRCEPRGS